MLHILVLLCDVQYVGETVRSSAVWHPALHPAAPVLAVEGPPTAWLTAYYKDLCKDTPKWKVGRFTWVVDKGSILAKLYALATS